MITLERKELPLGNPPVRGFLFEAYPLSILSVKDDYKSWFYSNYIQLCCYKEYIQRDEVFLQFFGPDQCFSSPYLTYQYLSWEAFPKNIVDVVDYVVSSIKDNYYFYCYVDEYYVPKRRDFEKFHRIHDLFLYGFDNETKEFLVLGYTDTHDFDKSRLSYEDFREAFLHNNCDKKVMGWTDRIYLFKYNESAQYEFDLQNVINFTEDYLASRNSDEHFRRYHNPCDDVIMGVATYDCIETYFNMLGEHKLSYDIRVAYILWEHKKCMRDRLEYMVTQLEYNELKDCYEAFVTIENTSRTLLNNMIKYQHNSKQKVIDKILVLLEQVKTQEIKTLKVMLEKMKKR